MVKGLPTFFLLCTMMCALGNVLAQTEDDMQGIFISLEDVYKFAPPQLPVYIDQMDTARVEIIDTLNNLHSFLAKETIGPYDYSWFFYIREEDRYRKVMIATRNASYDSIEIIDSIQQDVNGDGQLDVALSWQWYAGHTGWENAVHEREGGIMIWNLKNGQCLFEFTNFYQMENWWTIYEEDTTGTLSYEEREVIDSGGDFECDYFQVEILPKQIRIQRSPTCNGRLDKTEIKTDEDLKVYLYDLKDTWFVLRK